MRSMLTAMVVAAGIVGFGAVAQAAPVPVGTPGAAPVELAQMGMERRMMRRRMERRMVRRQVERRMIRRQVRRAVRRGM